MTFRPELGEQKVVYVIIKTEEDNVFVCQYMPKKMWDNLIVTKDLSVVDDSRFEGWTDCHGTNHEVVRQKKKK